MIPRVVCVIPARGGSKGVPGKNLLILDGETLVGRAVRVARAAPSVNEVAVSTDDAAIATEAERAGARVISRPAVIAGDDASSESALLHALDALEAVHGGAPEVLAFVQCTSPFTEASDIEGTVAEVLRGADSAFSALPSHLFLWRRVAEGSVAGVNHDAARRLRRQDRAADLIESGAVYAMRVDGFRRTRHRFFGRIAVHETPPERWLEIDTADDVAHARARLTLRKQSGNAIPARIDAVVFDFDGVMTDDLVSVNEDGSESVRCSRADGYGIERLRESGVRVAVISRETNGVVPARCSKLGIECMHAVADKAEAMLAWAERNGLEPEHLAYLGNDLPDLPCLRLVSWPVAVADAHPAVRAAAKTVLSRAGGHGAVRELCDLVLSQRISRGEAR